MSPPPQRAKIKAQSTEPPAVWKPPPPPGSYPTGGARAKETGARLSPDSGRGSGGTGSDSSNSYPEHLSRPSHNGYDDFDLNFNLTKNSNLLLCENIIFGRTSMKEEFERGYFSDFWNINIDKNLIHTEAINTGLFEKKYLNSFSALNNNSAVATIIFVGEKFLNKADNLSETLTNNENTTSNFSHWDNKLIVRLLSKDSYNLKFAIDKILSYFFEDSKIPKVWNI